MILSGAARRGVYSYFNTNTAARLGFFMNFGEKIPESHSLAVIVCAVFQLLSVLFAGNFCRKEKTPKN